MSAPGEPPCRPVADGPPASGCCSAARAPRRARLDELARHALAVAAREQYGLAALRTDRVGRMFVSDARARRTR
jgi:hypothetical protein